MSGARGSSFWPRVRWLGPAALSGLVILGCADGPTRPHRGERGAGGPVAQLFASGVVPRLLHINLSAARDLRRLITPAELPAPDAADGLGPGVALIITIPGEGRFGCSANFVWESGTRRFLGAAGHCFLPADRAGTHGPGADYDASGVTVDACVSDCAGNFRTNQLLGTWVRLGRVVYARQTQDGEDVGNDFGLVEIPASLIPGIRTSMPVWGGPSGVGTLGLGSLACHYGHGLVFGEVFATKARTGVGGGEEEGAWMGEFAAGPGDSGSGLVLCTPVLLGFSGGGAVGILTHLGIAADPETGEHGVVLGTTVARAIAMAAQAGLQVRVVPAL